MAVSQVSFDPDATAPVEQAVAQLQGRAANFHRRVQELDALIAGARERAARALVEDDDEEAELAAAEVRSLRDERATLAEAATMAEARLADQQQHLRALHTDAERREANARWATVQPAAKQLDDALAALDQAATTFKAALTNVHKLAPRHAQPVTVRQLLRRWLWARAPGFVDLIAERQGGIPRAAAGTRASDATPLAALFADEPAKRPYPDLEEIA